MRPKIDTEPSTVKKRDPDAANAKCRVLLWNRTLPGVKEDGRRWPSKLRPRFKEKVRAKEATKRL
jgi:hypothetical protein